MRTLFIILSLLSTISFADIIGGKLADAKKYPFMVNVIPEDDKAARDCGGSIIHERFILTAAHCVEGVRPEKLIVMPTAGTGMRMSSLKNIYRANNIYIHPNFRIIKNKSIFEMGISELSSCFNGEQPTKNEMVIKNDIALIELSRDLVFSDTISKVKIADKNANDHTTGTVMGWGRINDYTNESSRELKEAQLKTLPSLSDTSYWTKERKIKYFHSTLNLGLDFDNSLESYKGTLLLDASNGRSACTGDSGGPFVIKKDNEYIQYGVIANTNAGGGKCSGRLNALSSTTLHFDWISSIVPDL